MGSSSVKTPTVKALEEQMCKLAEPINLDCGLGKIGDSWKDEKKFFYEGKVSFDVPMTKEVKRLQEEIVGNFNRQYSEWLKRFDVAIGVKAYDDYNSPKLTVKTSAPMACRIIRTDNPDPNFWLKKFLKNEQETKEQEPSD